MIVRIGQYLAWKSGIWGCKKKQIEILTKSPLKLSKLSSLSFNIFTVGNVQNILMEHDLYLIS